MASVTESLRADWQAFLAFSPRLIYAAALLIVFLVAGAVTGRLVARVIRRTRRFRPNERFIRRIVHWGFGSAGILLALGVMGFKSVATSLLATGGVAAIVLGFAFREIGENLLAGVFLAFSRPFELRDLIKTGELTGTVRSINVRSVHIRTGDACDVFVPSARIFRDPLYNYTRDGLRRPSFKVGVAYHDSPQEVVTLLERSARSVTDVLDEPKVFVTINEFTANYVEYEVFFYLDVNAGGRDIVGVSNAVKTACWRALRDAGMTFSTDVTTSLDIQSVAPISIREAKQ